MVEITEVRIKLMSSKSDKLRAFCSITLDDSFVIRDVNVIEGTRGPFVAMPSRKLMERCQRCGEKNHCRAKFCNECGVRVLAPNRDREVLDRLKMHADIAHPIHQSCRELLQSRVLEEYLRELEKAKDPAYSPCELEVLDEDFLLYETGVSVEDVLEEREKLQDGWSPTDASGARKVSLGPATPRSDAFRPFSGHRRDRRDDPGRPKGTARPLGPRAGGGERMAPREVVPENRAGANREVSDSRMPRSQSRLEPLPEGKSLRDVASLGPLKAEEPPMKDRLPRGGAANEPEDDFGAGLLS